MTELVGEVAPDGLPVARRRPPRSRGRSWLVVALAMLAAVVGLELATGEALRPAPPADRLAEPGVAAMLQGVAMDHAELARVAEDHPRPTPLALPAQAMLDGLLLVVAASTALPRLLPRRDLARPARAGSFLAGLAILVLSVVVVVGAIGRLRYLVALYLSPPLGTLSYLLLYGSFPRHRALVAVAGLLALRAGACLALSPRQRTTAGLAATTLAATVVTAICYSWAPPAVAPITDALAASVAALAALIWSGIIVSGSLRRLS